MERGNREERFAILLVSGKMAWGPREEREGEARERGGGNQGEART